MRDSFFAWWNLVNLFNQEDAEAQGRRTDKVSRALCSNISGWTPQLRDRKIAQLASVIAAMNSGAGPDLLGVWPRRPDTASRGPKAGPSRRLGCDHR